VKVLSSLVSPINSTSTVFFTNNSSILQNLYRKLLIFRYAVISLFGFEVPNHLSNGSSRNNIFDITRYKKKNHRMENSF